MKHILISVLLLSGCWLAPPPPPKPTAEDIEEIRLSIQAEKRAYARHVTQCPNIQIKQERSDWIYPGFYANFVIVGCDRQWTAVYGKFGPPVVTETLESRARTQLKAVQDRLAVETGCLPDKIALISGSNWTVGAEQAYRFLACGKQYVCIYNIGHVECKVALAQ